MSLGRSEPHRGDSSRGARAFEGVGAAGWARDERAQTRWWQRAYLPGRRSPSCPPSSGQHASGDTDGDRGLAHSGPSLWRSRSCHCFSFAGIPVRLSFPAAPTPVPHLHPFCSAIGAWAARPPPLEMEGMPCPRSEPQPAASVTHVSPKRENQTWNDCPTLSSWRFPWAPEFCTSPFEQAEPLT